MRKISFRFKYIGLFLVYEKLADYFPFVISSSHRDEVFNAKAASILKMWVSVLKLITVLILKLSTSIDKLYQT